MPIEAPVERDAKCVIDGGIGEGVEENVELEMELN
jgi:hypothetical protein